MSRIFADKIPKEKISNDTISKEQIVNDTRMKDMIKSRSAHPSRSSQVKSNFEVHQVKQAFKMLV